MDHLDTSDKPKRSTLFVVGQNLAFFIGALLVGGIAAKGYFYFAGGPDVINGDYQVYFDGGDAGLIMYTSDTCAVCDDAKSYLAKLEVQFEEREIHSDPLWSSQLGSLGINSVPVLMFESEVLVGFRSKETKSALKRHSLL